MESAGIFWSMGAFQDGHLGGYIWGVIHPGLHYQTMMQATTDIFYVAPEHRKGTLGIRLFRAAEEVLRERGADRWMSGCKVAHPTGPLFARMGMRKFETMYVKSLRG